MPEPIGVLILGGTGMLGHKIFQHLEARLPNVWCSIRGSARDPGIEKIPFFRSGRVLDRIDLLKSDSIESLIAQHRPHTVVNCAGLVKQRPESHQSLPAIRLNALLPHRLLQACEKSGARLIHLSTDCVFSGRGGPYREQDPPDAEDLYGRTKALGEVTGPRALTLRTSTIGRELLHYHGLLEWFLAQNHGRVRGYRRALYSGVTTNYLACVIERLITQHPKLSGLCQLAGPAISKFDLLHLFRDAYGLDIEIIPDDSFFCDRRLDGSRFEKDTGLISPPWPEMIHALANDTTPYEEWRARAHAAV
ncbi:MAG TPA: SDR family oxidoreductase [Candidatus Sulfotelmatobacter sp.]|nr:SDR family oxidoreductase [Candidatus Sulfotelmatobacter sp.]